MSYVTPVTREISALDGTSEALISLSQWVDAGNAGRDPEAITWGRIAKIGEEFGEVIEAYIGATGQNPRKGYTHQMSAVLDELLDVALTALAAYEHLNDHHGDALTSLFIHINLRHKRAMASERKTR